MQVGRARDYVATGTTQLVEAKRIQKRSRKMQCCILILVLIIIAIIACAIAIPIAVNSKG